MLDLSRSVARHQNVPRLALGYGRPEPQRRSRKGLRKRVAIQKRNGQIDTNRQQQQRARVSSLANNTLVRLVCSRQGTTRDYLKVPPNTPGTCRRRQEGP